MALLEQLRAMVATMPPGSSVSLPVEWLRAGLEQEQGAVSAAADTPADLTVDQVAEKLGRSPSTVRNWLGEKRLPGAYRLRGREWRIPAATLAAFLEAEAGGVSTRVDTRTPPADLGAWRQVRGRGAA